MVHWDVLRGFALFGVLMANLPLMSMSRAVEWHTVELGHGPLDTLAFYFVRAVADSKFITVFSVLFGAGLGLMSEKAADKGAPFKRVYLRRLLALSVFGLVHGVFIWFGDILLHYALIGFVAMWMRRLRPWLLIVIALTLLVLTATVNLALSTVDPETFIEAAEGQSPEEAIEERRERIHDALSSADFIRATEIRAELWLEGALFLMFWGPRTLALFLIGIALVRTGILLRIADHLHIAKRAIVIGLGVGIPLQAVHLLFAAQVDDMPSRMANSATFFWTAIFLSPAYMGLVVLWTESGKVRRLRDGLAAVGRTAFTNYILQSVITGVIFNYFGQYDRWNRFEVLLLTFAIFALQIVASSWWLARFRFGPLEWLWRAFTYWRWQPMRTERAA